MTAAASRAVFARSAPPSGVLVRREEDSVLKLQHCLPSECANCGRATPATSARCPDCRALVRARARGGGLVSYFVDELEQVTAFVCDLETIEVRISS